MSVWDGHRAGSGARGLRALCALLWPRGHRESVVSDPRLSLHCKLIVPGKDALCQSCRQITKRLYLVLIDILTTFVDKIGMFSEERVFGFE